MCPYCKKSKKYSNKNVLTRHINNAHGELARDYTCELCGKVAKNLESLRSHAQHQHPGQILIDLKQDCFMCPEIFRTVRELNHHMRNVHNHIVKPVKVVQICNLCQRTFSSREKLLKHLNSKVCIKKQKVIENGLNDNVVEENVTVKLEKEDFVKLLNL